jgi:ribosomal protein S18 acetylase RimI-like enzyme
MGPISQTLKSLHDQTVTMDIRIEPYNDGEHRDQVVGLWTDVFGYTDARNEPGLVIDKKLAAGDGLFFVAMVDGRVAGTAMAGYDGHRGWIYSMAVLPGSRRRRIGTRLLEHAERTLRELGCVKINLQIFEHNESVRDFYLENGYQVEDRISMGKELSENVR